MEDSSGLLEVKYLGKDTVRDDKVLKSKPPYNYYEMIVNIDGKEYTVVLETSRYIKMEYGIPNWKHPYTKLKVNAIFGPEARSDFEEANERLELAEDETVGQKGKNVTLSLGDVILDFDYWDDLDLPEPERDIQKSVMEDLYQRKRRNLIATRQKSFEKQKGAVTLEDYILPQLPELSQQERARKMHDRMMQSVLTGRYGLIDYTYFMRKLVEAVKDDKVLISDAVIEALSKNHYYQEANSKHVHLFPVNSRKNIANTTIEDLGDVRKSSSDTKFRLMGKEPVNPEFKDYIDELYQGDSATTLGRIAQDDRESLINMVTYDPRTGKHFRRDTRGEFYIGEDTNGDTIFVEQTDGIIKYMISQKDNINGTSQEEKDSTELASKEERLQKAEKEAEAISEAESLIEQGKDKSGEKSKE